MPAAIAIPMLIGSGISAATSIAGAKIGSNAAKNAAAQQQQGVQQALAAQQQNFNTVLPMVQQGQYQAQQAFSPYQQMGGAALNALYQRLGIGGGAPLPYSQRPAMPPQPMMPPMMPQRPPMAPQAPMGMPPQGTFGHPMGGQPMPGQPPMGGMPQGAPGMMPMASLGLRGQ